jgi:aminomethyltransferase
MQNSINNLKKTPLFETHQALNAKIIDFGGWGMPVQYTSVLEEHRAVRNTAGLFDVSHMGEIEVKGKEALSLLQSLATNDVSKIPDFGAQYTVMCYPNGGAVDDLLIYRFSQDHYLLCVNASNIEKDFQWIKENNKTSAKVTDISAQTAQLAIQGPRSESILQKLTDMDLSSILYYHFLPGKVCGIDSLIARTGYTGEDGFEIFLPEKKAADLWRALSEAGKEDGLLPIGLGARDTLRLEMGYPLYGHELDSEHGPLCAGLGWIVKMDKKDFIGRAALLKQKEQGLEERLIGFEIPGRGIPRAEYPVLKKGEAIGKVTSGSFSPSLNKGIGMGYVKTGSADLGEELEIGIRSNPVPCKVVKPPFCKSRVKR